MIERDASTVEQTSKTRRPIVLAWTFALIIVKLLLITAMQNHNVSEFVYQGF